MSDIILTEYAQFDPNITIPDNGKPLTQAELATMLQPLANRTRYNLQQLNNSPLFIYTAGDDNGLSVSSRGVPISLSAFGGTATVYEYAATYTPPITSNVLLGARYRIRCKFRMQFSGGFVGNSVVLYSLGDYSRNDTLIGSTANSTKICNIDDAAVYFEATSEYSYNGASISIGVVVLRDGPPINNSILMSDLSLNSITVEFY